MPFRLADARHVRAQSVGRGDDATGAPLLTNFALANEADDANETDDAAPEPVERDDSPEPGMPQRAGQAIGEMWTNTIGYLRKPANARYVAVLAISLGALLVSLLDFGLITGRVHVPTPGLQSGSSSRVADTSTYNFEFDSDGWRARGAATTSVWNNTHTFAGQGALEAQVEGLTQQHNGFIFVTAPQMVKPGSTVIAHVYVPAGAPPVIVTLYALDGSWSWTAGAYPTLEPGAWTAVRYSIPTTVKGPIREMGLMVVGAANSAPYTGPLYVDAVNVSQ